MTEIASRIEIAATPDAVFQWASDLRNESTWNPDARSILKVTEAPVGLGTKYRAQWKGSPMLDVECIAFEPPRSWTHHNGGPVEVTSQFRVEPASVGSVLDCTFTVKGHGIGKVFAPILARKMRKQIPTNLERIRQHLQSA
jgi:hypothetical protein